MGRLSAFGLFHWTRRSISTGPQFPSVHLVCGTGTSRSSALDVVLVNRSLILPSSSNSTYYQDERAIAFMKRCVFSQTSSLDAVTRGTEPIDEPPAGA